VVAVTASGRRPRIDCVGPVNVDLLIQADWPTDLAALAQWVGPSEVELGAAGPVGYTARGLAGLGRRTRVFSTVGDDAFGEHLVRDLNAAGVETSGISVCTGPTTLAIYPLLFGGTKRPLTYRLTCAPPWPEGLDSWLDSDFPDILYVGGLLHYLGRHPGGLPDQMAMARAHGVVTALDPQFPLAATPTPWRPYIRDELRNTDILLCDISEATSLFGCSSAEDAAGAAVAAGCSVAVVKMGAEGAIALDRDGVVAQDAIALGSGIRTPVGAGDVFNAGFLSSWIDERSVSAALRMATATASAWLTSPAGEAFEPPRIAAMLERVPAARRLSGTEPDRDRAS
jgi:2-dehydro-3-deoxygluconokinase